MRTDANGQLAARRLRDVVMALVDIDEAKAREVASRDDEIDRLYHRYSTTSRKRCGPPVQGGSRHAHPLRRSLPRAHRRPRHQHREDVVFLATGEVEYTEPLNSSQGDEDRPAAAALQYSAMRPATSGVSVSPSGKLGQPAHSIV